MSSPWTLPGPLPSPGLPGPVRCPCVSFSRAASTAHVEVRLWPQRVLPKKLGSRFGVFLALLAHVGVFSHGKYTRMRF